MLRQYFNNLVLDESVLFDIVAADFSSTDLYETVWTAVESLCSLQIFHCGSCHIVREGTENVV